MYQVYILHIAVYIPHYDIQIELYTFTIGPQSLSNASETLIVQRLVRLKVFP